MRCFVAIDLDKELAGKVRDVQEGIMKLGVDVKMVEPENLHFTLKFIGEINESELAAIKNELHACFRGVSEFTMNIHGMGYFGGENYIRTLWLGVKEGEDDLLKLMKLVNTSLKTGKTNYSPHLTLGRVKTSKNKGDLLDFISSMKDVKVGEMKVEEVKLKSSVLSTHGPAYSDIEIFTLNKSIL